ncbi:adenosylcobinamide-phosphate synthase CbiB [Clostridium amazonitimonense]|uniref:adenosylcobinamide-phosphate synthase CbiB n=1 Tax=Clostridium amazonitimonense TaxID=1499689 RepID=UPI000509E623|nr:adenosylcobinamide-phosphate synthase CbiB [Clostridium amazonitimonense]
MFLVDLAVAIIIDWIIGDPYGFPHPVIYMGKVIRFLENKGRKIIKNEKNLKIYGLFIVFILCATSFFIPYVILYLAKPYKILYHLLSIFMLWTTIAARCLHKEGKKIYEDLIKEDIQASRLHLSYIVGRNTENLSEKEIIRADIETVAENTSDGVIAPLLFAAIGGAPLAMMYKAINTMDSMLGYMNDKYRYIGYFPAKIDDVFNYVPARITGALICLSAPLVKGNILNAFKIMIRDRKNHKSPNCAYPEAAVAGALNIQLGGTNTYFGEIIEKPTIGDSVVELKNIHIIDTIKLMYFSEVLFYALYFGVLKLIQQLW